MKKLLLLLGFLAGTAHAADEYYSIQSGSVAADVGGVTATGFFETNGFGKSGYIPGTETYNPVVIGFDITLRYDGTSVNLCGGAGYGCQQNDLVLPSQGITATPNGLFCGSNCLLTDIGNGPGIASAFTFYNRIDGVAGAYANYQIGDRIVNGVGYDNLLVSTTVPVAGSIFNITGGRASTTMPSAPELDPGQAGAALMLLVGVGLVLRARRMPA
jgi:hypothetical protein